MRIVRSRRALGALVAALALSAPLVGAGTGVAEPLRPPGHAGSPLATWTGAAAGPSGRFAVPRVVSTWDLERNRSYRGNYVPSSIDDPTGLVVDDRRNETFIADAASDNLTVLSSRTDLWRATIAVGVAPGFLAYDARLDEVFVANNGSGNVSVVSAVSDRVVASVPVGANPQGMALDPRLGELFVANSGSDTVSVISDRTNTVVGTIAVGSGPYDAVYDSGRQEVFVSNRGSANLSVIADRNDTVVATIPLNGSLAGLAYDPAQHEIFVAGGRQGYWAYGVSVIADRNDTVVGWVQPAGRGALQGPPTLVTYDAALDEVFAAGPGINVTAIYASSDSVGADVDPCWHGWAAGIAYDARGSEILVACDTGYGGTPWVLSDGGFVATIADASVAFTGMYPPSASLYPPYGTAAGAPEYTAPDAVAFDNATDQLFLANFYGRSVTVISLNGSRAPLSIGVGGRPVAIVYDAGRAEMFVANFYTGNVSVISTKTDRVVASVASYYGGSPLALAYDPNSGLIFVLNAWDPIWVVSDSTHQILRTFSPGGTYPAGCGTLGSPAGLAYDNTSRELWIDFGGTPCVGAYAPSNGTLLKAVSLGASAGYGGGPAYYDAAAGEVFFANQGSDNLSGVWASNATFAGALPCGEDPSAIGSDAGAKWLFVADPLNDTVAVLDLTNGRRVAELPVGQFPSGIVGNGRSGVYVVNALSGTLSFVKP